MTSSKHIFSVSELNASAKLALEQEFGLVWLEAELSNLSRPASGHWYFSLKDKKAQIRCAFFKGRNRLLNFSPEDGQQLLVRGRVSLYEPRGDYQLIVDHMEPAGVGDLQKAYEEIKQRLHESGLFDEQHKLELPAIPCQIGLVTSPSGAAIRDALHVLQRRFPLVPVVVYPTMVQGEAAAGQIIEAIKCAEQRNECDVLLLVRGGGSLEDLWPFNNEQLARTIFDCTIPIVTGIGHEIDTTIADFVADTRAPTPSAAAEIIVPDGTDLEISIQQLQTRLTKQMEGRLRNSSQHLDWYMRHLQQFHPGKQLSIQRARLKLLSRHLLNAMRLKLNNQNHAAKQLNSRIQSRSPVNLIMQYRDKTQAFNRLIRHKMTNTLELARYRLDNSAHALNTVSPIATLSRGYSISRQLNTRTPVKLASEFTKGEMMETQLARGKVISKVESIDD
ncbi:MAG: exodeoxyribonuclease VII large subunit [Gammaproteobacteria bacterium]|nr:exodeoxyribonuclease VII large subunit [Gammaproteobacteria bacterium]